MNHFPAPRTPSQSEGAALTGRRTQYVASPSPFQRRGNRWRGKKRGSTDRSVSSCTALEANLIHAQEISLPQVGVLLRTLSSNHVPKLGLNSQNSATKISARTPGAICKCSRVTREALATATLPATSRRLILWRNYLPAPRARRFSGGSCLTTIRTGGRRANVIAGWARPPTRHSNPRASALRQSCRSNTREPVPIPR